MGRRPRFLRRSWRRTADNLRLVAERGSGTLRRHSRFAYIGGEGAGNLGDDAMYVAATRLLAPAGVMAYDAPERERRLAGLGLAGPGYFRGAILGGGTLVNPRWAAPVRAALRQGLELWSLGTGVGSCGFVQPRSVSLAEWQPLLARFHRLGVRGPRSQRALLALGIDRSEVVGDPALSFANEAQAPSAEPPRFAISLRYPPTGLIESNSVSVLEQVGPSVKDLLGRGWTAVPLAMQASDVRPLTQLLSEIAGTRAPAVNVVSSVGSFMDKISGCHFCLSVRLHSAVLACCAGVPPLMLGYRDKCLDFMESMELEDWHLEYGVTDPAVVSDNVRRLIDAAPPLRNIVLARAQKWKARLEAYVDSIFLGGPK